VPTLHLASEFKELQDISSAALGDLVAKFQEIVLLDVILMIHSRLSTGAPNERVGVCKGLSEVMGSANKTTMAQFLPQLTAAITAGVSRCFILAEGRIQLGEHFKAGVRGFLAGTSSVLCSLELPVQTPGSAASIGRSKLPLKPALKARGTSLRRLPPLH
jgi:hypothetical protein